MNSVQDTRQDRNRLISVSMLCKKNNICRGLFRKAMLDAGLFWHKEGNRIKYNLVGIEWGMQNRKGIFLYRDRAEELFKKLNINSAPDGYKQCVECRDVKPIKDFISGRMICRLCQQKKNERNKKKREKMRTTKKIDEKFLVRGEISCL